MTHPHPAAPGSIDTSVSLGCMDYYATIRMPLDRNVPQRVGRVLTLIYPGRLRVRARVTAVDHEHGYAYLARDRPS